ncbi:class I SAM-dependent methyltransferase [Myxococcota bacterium]|nr:class I SAM-dependent methyltransferase [Myxococcota bacterium]
MIDEIDPREGAALTWALRSLLSAPAGHARPYSLLQRAVGRDRMLRRLVDEALALRPGDRVLDVGCGPADVLAFLPSTVAYTGVEPHAPYREGARRRFGAQVDIRADRVQDLPTVARFDRVLLLGVLHHLPDPEASALLRACQARCAPEGAVVVLEPCPRPGRGWIEQQLFAIDRGRHIRPEASLRALVHQADPGAAFSVWQGMLRLPYTTAVIELRP